MKLLTRTSLAVLFLLIMFMLAACKSLPDTQTAAVATLPPAQPVSSSTPLPVDPARTAQPTVTASPAFTATPQPTPTLPDDIRQVTLVTHGVLPNWKYLFTFGFTEEVQGGYRLVVDQNKEYNCTTRSDQPGYLYCDGPMAAFDDFVEYKLISEDGSLTVLEGRVYIPPEFTP